jgi:hypothetical protein
MFLPGTEGESAVKRAKWPWKPFTRFSLENLGLVVQSNHRHNFTRDGIAQPASEFRMCQSTEKRKIGRKKTSIG